MNLSILYLAITWQFFLVMAVGGLKKSNPEGRVHALVYGVYAFLELAIIPATVGHDPVFHLSDLQVLALALFVLFTMLGLGNLYLCIRLRKMKNYYPTKVVAKCIDYEMDDSCPVLCFDYAGDRFTVVGRWFYGKNRIIVTGEEYELYHHEENPREFYVTEEYRYLFKELVGRVILLGIMDIICIVLMSLGV